MRFNVGLMSLGLVGVLLGFPHAAIPNNVSLANAFGTMTFNRPVYFAEVPGRDSVYVVAEQLAGTVVAVRRVSGAWTKSNMVTVTVPTNQNQMGLLGFAFHPQFATNRKYYLSYNPTTTTTRIEERVADSSMILDAGAASARIVMTVTQPGTAENGGGIAFGPDGYLYIGLGYGGGNSGDQQNRSQTVTDLLGKILRINVDSTEAGLGYAIPADNPRGTGWRAEIWALGLRNPWRWSFHPVSGELWVGDVGQGNPNSTSFEEISRVPKGGNMGWRILEGASCYPPPSTASCDTTGLTPPALSIARSLATTIVGGEFFLGDPSGGFHDTYFFGDYASGRIWAARTSGGTFTEYAQLGVTLANVSSFARAHGRLFAVQLGTSSGMSVNANTGRVMLLSSPDMIPAPVAIRPGSRAATRPVSRRELLSGGYLLRTLDGRAATPDSRGVLLAYRRGVAGAPVLVPPTD